MLGPNGSKKKYESRGLKSTKEMPESRPWFSTLFWAPPPKDSPIALVPWANSCSASKAAAPTPAAGVPAGAPANEYPGPAAPDGSHGLLPALRAPRRVDHDLGAPTACHVAQLAHQIMGQRAVDTLGHTQLPHPLETPAGLAHEEDPGLALCGRQGEETAEGPMTNHRHRHARLDPSPHATEERAGQRLGHGSA